MFVDNKFYTTVIQGDKEWTACGGCRNRTFYVEIGKGYIDTICISCKQTVRSLILAAHKTEKNNG